MAQVRRAVWLRPDSQRVAFNLRVALPVPIWAPPSMQA
jgi:hypothetical protein